MLLRHDYHSVSMLRPNIPFGTADGEQIATEKEFGQFLEYEVK